MDQQTHHSSDCEVRALLLLLAILEHIIKREDTGRNQIVWLQKIKILEVVSMERQVLKGSKAYLMIDAKLHVLTPLLLLLHETCGKRTTSCVNDATTLFPLDRRMQTKVFARSETQSSEVFDVAKLLGSIFHQGFQFCESFFDLRHCT